MPAEPVQVNITRLRRAIASTLHMPLHQLQGFVLITVDSEDMTGLIHTAPDVDTACDVASTVFASIPHGHGTKHHP